MSQKLGWVEWLETVDIHINTNDWFGLLWSAYKEGLTPNEAVLRVVAFRLGISEETITTADETLVIY